ncbi:hypothetical protein WJX81_006201 [Elliptochloris bilobata]|uniref:3-ketoacyl-CoA synthase n=1 Tax=Elliptochloris bilobata TaxID=381761 RepID=A0AAW1RUL9_9CHLO
MGRGGTVGGSEVPDALRRLPEPIRAWAMRKAKAVFHFTCSHLVELALAAIVSLNAGRILEAHQHGELAALWGRACEFSAQRLDLSLGWALAAQAAVLAAAAALLWLLRPARGTYLVDWYSFRPPDRMAVSVEDMNVGIQRKKCWNEESKRFMGKVMEISGLGQSTFLPDEVKAGKLRDMDQSNTNKRAETELVLFTSIQRLFENTGIDPASVDAVITTCCTFNPTPSLSAFVVNRFGLRPSVKTYSLGGMGCSASLIALDLANELLKSNAGMRVLVAGTENILDNMYWGSQRSMLITCCIFRLGGVAALLSNRRGDARRAKYRLAHLVRTHLGASDEAYNCVMQKDDETGQLGMRIGRDLMSVAGKALRQNITELGPRVLPLSEKLIFAGNFVARKVLGVRIKPRVPDFSTAFQHFCIHPGGKAVIEEVGKQLRLTPRQCLPMVVPFERFGNTSSSSTWYAWGYVETVQGVRRGERVWQLAFGSGFKCNSAVWVALRDCRDQHDAWTETPSC